MLDLEVKNHLKKDAETTVHNFFAMAGLMGIKDNIEFAKKCLPVSIKLLKQILQEEIEREKKINNLKNQNSKTTN